MQTGKTFSAVNLMGLFLLRLCPFFNPDTNGPRLLVSSEYDPWSILEMTYKYLSGSASIVFHSPHLQVKWNRPLLELADVVPRFLSIYKRK